MVLSKSQFGKIEFIFSQRTKKKIFFDCSKKLEEMDFCVNEDKLLATINNSSHDYSKLKVRLFNDKLMYNCLVYIFGEKFYCLEEFEYEWFMFERQKIQLCEIFKQDLIESKIDSI